MARASAAYRRQQPIHLEHRLPITTREFSAVDEAPISLSMPRLATDPGPWHRCRTAGPPGCKASGSRMCVISLRFHIA